MASNASNVRVRILFTDALEPRASYFISMSHLIVKEKTHLNLANVPGVNRAATIWRIYYTQPQDFDQR
jgi:hypothetical protein